MAFAYVPFRQVLDDALADPPFRAEWERLTLARTVATALVKYRQEHNLTQQQLADRLGWVQPVIARMERGERNPSLGSLMVLIHTLGGELTIRPSGITLLLNVLDNSSSA